MMSPPVSNAPLPTKPAGPTTPGTLLAGKYRVARILGQGGVGVVVEARHIELDERVALKFLLPELAHQPEAASRFLREARNAVKIKSEHIARVMDVGRLDTGAPYMVMEFLEGRDLAGALDAGVLAIPDAVDYVIQGCEAIAEAHGHGIVHRDLKPANLFLSRRPDGSPLVKVLDFGISKSGRGAVDNLTRPTGMLGSVLYMSPEQMQEARSVDHRTDIYALGISLYELLAGRQPYYGETVTGLCSAVLTGTPTPIRELRPAVPEALAAVMARAYARDRDHRYASIGELVVALAPFAPPRSAPTIERVARMSGLPVPEPPPPAPPPPVWPPPSSNPNQIVPGPAITGRPRSKGAMLVVSVLASLALGGVGTAAALTLRGKPAQPSAAMPSATASSAVAQAMATQSAAPPVPPASSSPETRASADPVRPPDAKSLATQSPLPAAKRAAGSHSPAPKSTSHAKPPPARPVDPLADPL